MEKSQQFDPLALRKALGAFATGVTVITTRSQDNRDVGITVNSFNSVSLDPPLILWSLGKNAERFAAFSAADYFAVHILAADQVAISNHFAGRDADNFAGLAMGRGIDGIPLLDHCAASFSCRTAFRYEGGDHVIIVGEVLSFARSELPPLLFHNGRYATIGVNA